MKTRFDLTEGSSTAFPALAQAMAALPEADRQWLEAARAACLHHQAITDNRCSKGREAIAKRIAKDIEQAVAEHAAAYPHLAPRERAGMVHTWAQCSTSIDHPPSLKVIRQYLNGRST